MIRWSAFLATCTLFAATALAAGGGGIGAGNGGSFSKSTRFTEVGKGLYRRLKAYAQDRFPYTPRTLEWYLPYHGKRLPLHRIPWALNDRNIVVVEGDLPDANGSRVSARVDEGSPVDPRIRKILLKEGDWNRFFDHPAEIELMVCHELMRAIRVDDDQNQVCDYLLTLKGGTEQEIRAEEYRPMDLAWLDEELRKSKFTPDAVNDELRFTPHDENHWHQRSFVWNYAESLSHLKTPHESYEQVFSGPLEISANFHDFERVKPDDSRFRSSAYVVTGYYSDNVIPLSREGLLFEYKRAPESSRTPVDEMAEYYIAQLGHAWLPDDKRLSVEDACLKRQVDALNALRDASSQEESSRRFQQLMERHAVEFFELGYEVFPTTPLPEAKTAHYVQIYPGMGEKAQSMIVAPEIEPYPYASKLSLSIETSDPQPAPKSSPVQKLRLRIRFSLAGDDCRALRDTEILARLARLVEKL